MNWNGIRFWAYNAGHVLGAAMFLVEIAGVRVLYTGDFSRQEDRHLKEAEIPPFPPDIIIVESTYGVQVHEPRKIREARFTQKVAEIVRRGGRVLLPVFALGRAQELLLILEEYWEAHPDLQDIPIYYASSLAKRCMSVYQTYINMMNDNIRKRYEVSNPFAFKYVLNVKNIQDFDDSGPCVFMASPGMLQSGLSRELCERWCTDRRNGIILPGYSVEGTLAKHILSEPSTITRLDGKEVPLRCSVDYITFSAHSDFLQTSEFIDRSRSGHIVLVHGEMTEMGRLRNALDLKYNKGQSVPNIRIYTPKNCQTVRLTFRAEKVAKAIGEVAKRKPEDGASMSGILVKRDFNYTLMSPNELNTYTGLKVSRIQQRLVVPLKKPFSQLATELNHLLEGTVLDIDEETKRPQLDILGAIQVTLLEDGESASVEWCTNYATDILVENIVYLCITHSITSAPVLAMDAVSVYRSKQSSSFEEEEKDEDFLYSALSMSRKLLEERFGALQVIDEDKSRFQVDSIDVIVDHRRGIVECEQHNIRERVELALRRIYTIMFPIPDYFCECCGC
ncbi:Cleavage and polyadenylation specificity factor subunit 3-I [Galdieria sulphuraria]|nr:Cleavage and polyadenylation specificity factor subunit 3-I [Galdieria sulphuraria]